MKRTIAATFAVLLAGGAAAAQNPAQQKPEQPAQGRMESPRLTRLTIDWPAAATALGAATGTTPAETFAPLNDAMSVRFPGIATSGVPVLLPFDIEAYRKARAARPDKTADADGFVLGGFHASKFFLAGPAGYDAAFSLQTADVRDLRDIRYRKPVYLLLSGLALVYDLDGPALPEGQPVKELQDKFPGIRRILFESYVRYVFERYGATYVVATYCQDRRPNRRYLTCKQADRIITRLLDTLHLVGGGPAPQRAAMTPPPVERPKEMSPDFTYFSPGFLIPGTGFKPSLDGRADYTVYGNLRYPMKDAPSFANSQSFNNWGNCDTVGRRPRRLGKKGMRYSCKVNDLTLVFDESAGPNYSYPWRDNFCEHRYFFAGQCPGGLGHQGQDIRPSYCKMFNEGADRCLPYEHDVVAVGDAMILRAPKLEALIMFINAPDTHLRVRYMHMDPARMDADGLLSGKQIKRGEVIGKVANYNDFANGTTYHLHFDLQVPTRVGWALVNPYMTLVAAYERLIGARGTEIKPGDPVPATAPVPPVIDRPDDAGIALPPQRPSETTAPDKKPGHRSADGTETRRPSSRN